MLHLTGPDFSSPSRVRCALRPAGEAAVNVFLNGVLPPGRPAADRRAGGFSVLSVDRRNREHVPQPLSRGTLVGLAAIRRALDDRGVLDAFTAERHGVDARGARRRCWRSSRRPAAALRGDARERRPRWTAAWRPGRRPPAAARAAAAARAPRRARSPMPRPWRAGRSRGAAAEALLAACDLRPAEGAATSHTVSFLRGMFQAWYEKNDARLQSAPHGASAIRSERVRCSSERGASRCFTKKRRARRLAVRGGVVPAGGRVRRRRERMGRLAFVGALCGAAPGALDGFCPWTCSSTCAPGDGDGDGNGDGNGNASIRARANGTASISTGRRPARGATPPPRRVGRSGRRRGLTGNLIDF